VAVIWVLVAIAVLGGVAAVAAGRGVGLPPAEPDRPDVALPPGRAMAKDDVDTLRFSVGLRGYRMDEVDDVLDRLATEIALRDARIADLETTAPEPAGDGPPAEVASAPAAPPADPTVSRTMIVPVQELSAPPVAPAPAAAPEPPDDPLASPGPG
jgi:DivIVA domain-containing protein